jgi:flagellar biosynthetic protein FlhB
MGVAKMALLSLVAYVTIAGRVGAIAFSSQLEYLGVVALAGDLIMSLGIRLALVLLILGIIDFAWQRYKTNSDLMMTKEEIREEMKRMDGDPKLKQRRREIQMQMTMQRIKSAVPKADVVVTNPTELAIVIRYDSGTMSAPKVTAKGADYVAKRIRELAIEHGIPLVERKPLARALYATVEVGQEIPPQFYKAVAEILAYVYELAGKGYQRPARAAAG